jgi:hypothetical protein
MPTLYIWFTPGGRVSDIMPHQRGSLPFFLVYTAAFILTTPFSFFGIYIVSVDPEGKTVHPGNFKEPGCVLLSSFYDLFKYTYFHISKQAILLNLT